MLNPISKIDESDENDKKLMPLQVNPTSCVIFFFTFLFSVILSKYPPHKGKLFTASVFKAWSARVAAGRNDEAVMDN